MILDENNLQDNLVSYALGTLTLDEERQVESYLREHPSEAEKVSGYLEGLTALVLTQEPEPLPAEATELLLARVRWEEQKGVIKDRPVRERPPNWSGWLGAAAAAALLFGVWFGFSPPSQSELLEARLQNYLAQPGATRFELRGEAGEDLGTLVRLEDGQLFVALESEPASGRTYQAWEIAGSDPVSLGTFERSFLTRRVPQGSTFAISREPEGGSPQPTTTPITAVEL